jgi:hypothetical protein
MNSRPFCLQILPDQAQLKRQLASQLADLSIGLLFTLVVVIAVVGFVG